ncbi:MAG: ABC transporter permease, partial [Sphingomonas sp.]
MSAMADFQQDGADTGTLRFTGDLSLANIGNLPDRLEAVDAASIKRVDLSQVDRIDTIGAWIVHRFAARNDATIDGLDADGQNLFDQVVASDQPLAARGKPVGSVKRVLGEIGDAVVLTGRTMLGLLAFLGATTIAFG